MDFVCLSVIIVDMVDRLLILGLLDFKYSAPPQTRPRQFSPKVEHTLVRVCIEKEGAFQFEAWSMDSNKKGCF